MDATSRTPRGRPDNRIYELAKRSLDVVGAVLGILILSPLLVLIALLIKLTSPGPVFYRGVRSGRYGTVFRIYKFRSMVTGAERGAGTTSRNDPRITPIGRFLRRYKLDEIPQLFNVLFGQMSLVGPRPELPRYTDQYSGEELLILEVKPGITDYSSLKFSKLNELIEDDDPDRAFEENVLKEKNRLRIQYVNNHSFWRDLDLIFMTIGRIMGIK